MNFFLRLSLVLFLAYLFLIIFFFFMQKNLIFLPTQKDIHTCDSFPEFSVESYNTTNFLYKDQQTDSIIIVYHGNAGSVCDRSYFLPFLQTNSSLLFVEYAGFSKDNPNPSFTKILQNVHDTIAFVNSRNYSSVKLVGESLGSSVGSYHAKNQDVTALFLISPFSSIRDVGQMQYPFLPVSLFLTQRFDTVSWLKDVESPLYIIHAEFDEVVPKRSKQILRNSLEGKEVFEVISKGKTHNTILNSVEFKDHFSLFLER